MYMLEITENRCSDLSEHIKGALKHMYKIMQCIPDFEEEQEMDTSYQKMLLKEQEEHPASIGRYSRY